MRKCNIIFELLRNLSGSLGNFFFAQQKIAIVVIKFGCIFLRSLVATTFDICLLYTSDAADE